MTYQIPPPPTSYYMKLPSGLILSEGEKPIWYSHPTFLSHIGGIIGYSIWLFFGVICYFISLQGNALLFLAIWGLLVIFLGLIGLVSVFLDIFFTEFFISNRRVYIKMGILGRSTHDLRTEWITGSSLQQGMFARTFSYGNIIFNGVGFSNAAMKGVPNVLSVKGIVDGVLQTNKQRVEIEDKLKRLQEEFDFGRITEAKYQELKQKYEAERNKY